MLLAHQGGNGLDLAERNLGLFDDAGCSRRILGSGKLVFQLEQPKVQLNRVHV
jgi:hypothetical protein